MNTSSFWFFESVLTPRFCDEIIKYGLSKKENLGNIANTGKKTLDKEKINDLKKIRNSNVVWLNDAWIYKEIHPYIHEANKKAGWNFQWDWSEDCQFTKYKLNQYYDWHRDTFDHPFNCPENKDQHGKIRKLSVTCQLSDVSDYEGGELEFDFRDYNPTKRDESLHVIRTEKILKKGSIIVFPSYIWHRVKPVLKGTRYSLVIWNCGYPFK